MADRVKILGLLFDNNQETRYSPGEAVSGHVLIELSVPTQIKAIRLSATGYGRVGWIDKLQSRISGALNIVSALSVSHCVEEREYLCLSKTLLEAAGNKSLSLEAGRHEIPFELELPQRPLVSSFTGKHGCVYYSLKAVLQIPKIPDQHFCRELPIISHVDINSPELVHFGSEKETCPVSESSEEMIGCCIFASGPVSLRVTIERKGYNTGESVPIYAEIENCSSRLIMPKAVIYQIQSYKARGKTISHKQLVSSVRGNHVPSGCSVTWNGKTLKIPPACPSILNSDILRVEYSVVENNGSKKYRTTFFRVHDHVQIPGAKKLKVELPIVIGTTPYNGFGSHSFSLTSGFSTGCLPLTLPDTSEAPPNYADVVSQEEMEQHHSHISPSQPPDELERHLTGPSFAYTQDFRLQPPPLYSKVSPPSNRFRSQIDPNQVECQTVFSV